MREPLPGLTGVTLERDVPCRMPDGASLLADVYRPATGGPHPVLLISQPYDKRAAESNVGIQSMWDMIVFETVPAGIFPGQRTIAGTR